MNTRETAISHNTIGTHYVQDNYKLSLQYDIVYTVRKPHYLTFQVKLILEHQIDNLDRGLLKVIDPSINVGVKTPNLVFSVPSSVKTGTFDPQA